jgi:hypothetical protein
LPGAEKMELIKKLLELISEFLESRKQDKIEKEEIHRVRVEQELKTNEKLKRKPNDKPKKPKEDDFFNDNDW